MSFLWCWRYYHPALWTLHSFWCHCLLMTVLSVIYSLQSREQPSILLFDLPWSLYSVSTVLSSLLVYLRSVFLLSFFFSTKSPFTASLFTHTRPTHTHRESESESERCTHVHSSSWKLIVFVVCVYGAHVHLSEILQPVVPWLQAGDQLKHHVRSLEWYLCYSDMNLPWSSRVSEQCICCTVHFTFI